MAGFDERTGRRDARLNAVRGRLGAAPELLESIDRRTTGSPNSQVLQMHGKTEIIPGRRSRAQGYRRPLQPFNLREDEGTWKLDIQPGFLFSSHVENMATSGGTPTESSILFYTPEIDGTPITSDGLDGEDLDNWERPSLDLTAFDSWIYLKFYTTKHGVIDYDPEGDPAKPVEIIASDTELDSTHDYQEDEDNAGGQDGTHYVQIARTKSNGESGDAEAPILLHEGHQSNLMWQGRVNVRNLGTGKRVFKDVDPDNGVHRLRTILGNYGVAINEVDQLELNCDPENVGENGCDVWVQPVDEEGDPLSVSEYPDETMKFRKLQERQTGGTAQIQVSCEPDGEGVLPDEITIQGNGINDVINIEADDETQLLSVQASDGLITEALHNLEVVTVKICRPAIEVGGSASDPPVVQTWEILGRNVTP